MLRVHDFKEPDEAQVDIETLTVLMSIKNMTIQQFEATSLEEKIKIGRALLTLLGPAEQLKQRLINVFNDPLITPYYSRLGQILKPGLVIAAKTFYKKKLDSATELHKLIYLSLAKNIRVENSAPEYNDAYIREAILQRTAHVADLELIYLSNLNFLFELLIDDLMDISGHIIQGIIRKIVEDSSFFYEYLNQSMQMNDFLPDNKFLALMIHPDDLWNNGAYDKFKTDTNLDFIKAKFLHYYNVLSINSDLFMDKLSLTFFNLRNETIRVYDLLAESDRLLMQHCQRKKYNPDKLFALNQSVVTALLNRCEENLDTVSDEQRFQVDQYIKFKVTSINKHNTWIIYSNDMLKMDLKLTSYWNQNPAEMLDVLAAWFEGLQNTGMKQLIVEIFNSGFLTKLLDLVRPMLPLAMQSTEASKTLVKSKAQKISQIKDGIIKYLDAIEKAKKGGGFARIKLFLINQHILGKGSFSIFDKNDLTRLRGVFGDENDLSVEEKLKLYCKTGQFKKAKPLLKTAIDFYPYILIALQNKQSNFVLDLFKEIKNRDKELISIIPDQVIQQEKLLRAVLSLPVNQLQSSVTIITLLFEFGPWKKQLIEAIAEGITEPVILNLFIPPKQDIASNSSGLDDEEETVITSTRLSVQKSSVVISSALFKPQSLFAKDPLLKIRIFAEEKCSAEEVNVQCYALVMGLIQFFQAYHLTRKDNLIPGFTCDNARRMRNALVHQQVYNPDSNSVFLLLDGEAENLLAFVNALIYSVNTKNSGKFLTSQLYKKVLQHGDALAGQQKSGEREQVKLYHRVLYTHWLSKTSVYFEKMQDNSSLSPDMLEHAKAALAISRQLYCLKEAGCPQADLEQAQAKAIRHMNTQLPVNVTQSKTPGIKKTG